MTAEKEQLENRVDDLVNRVKDLEAVLTPASTQEVASQGIDLSMTLVEGRNIENLLAYCMEGNRKIVNDQLAKVSLRLLCLGLPAICLPSVYDVFATEYNMWGSPENRPGKMYYRQGHELKCH